MSEVIRLGDRRELFVDHYLIDTLENAALKLHPPRPAEVSIRIDRPWEGEFNGGCCVIQHDGGFRMYYRGLKPDGIVCLCCAESADGVHWTKPELNLAEVVGSGRNNVLVADTPNYDIFLDTRPGVPSGERFKMTRYYVGGQRLTPYFAGAGTKEVYLLVAEDGLRFRETGDAPILTCDLPNAFDSHNVFFWSDVEGQYVCYFRFMDGHRTIARITSPNLHDWSAPVPMSYGDTPREHLYTNSTTPYFRAPHIYVALPARFMPERRVVTDAQLATMKIASSGPHVYYNDCSDGVFMTTRAGSARYDRTFMESYVRPGTGQNNWVSRTNYPLHGLLKTGPDELSFYVSRDYAQPTWHIRRYTLRVDGFTSVNAPYRGGNMTTKALTFSGCRLEINYATGAAGGLRIALQRPDGMPIPGFTLEDCDPLIGDEIDRVVSWKGNTDVSALRESPVRLHCVMQDADLYAIRFA